MSQPPRYLCGECQLALIPGRVISVAWDAPRGALTIEHYCECRTAPIRSHYRPHRGAMGMAGVPYPLPTNPWLPAEALLPQAEIEDKITRFQVALTGVHNVEDFQRYCNAGQ